MAGLALVFVDMQDNRTRDWVALYTNFTKHMDILKALDEDALNKRRAKGAEGGENGSAKINLL